MIKKELATDSTTTDSTSSVLPLIQYNYLLFQSHAPQLLQLLLEIQCNKHIFTIEILIFSRKHPPNIVCRSLILLEHLLDSITEMDMIFTPTSKYLIVIKFMYI